MNNARVAELLAMLTAKVERLEPTVSTFGALTREDVTFALALVQNLPARLFARLKFAGEDHLLEVLEIKLIEAVERQIVWEAISQEAPKRWKQPRPGFVHDLCRLALIEAINPKLCMTCGGATFVFKEDAPLRIDCPACDGSGVGTISNAQRANVLGVSVNSFEKHWNERYSDIQACVNRWEDIVLGGIRKRLK